MISNLFELKYVLNKELLKVLVGKVDAQLLKAAQHIHIQHSSFILFRSSSINKQLQRLSYNYNSTTKLTPANINMVLHYFYY